MKLTLPSIGLVWNNIHDAQWVFKNISEVTSNIIVKSRVLNSIDREINNTDFYDSVLNYGRKRISK